MSQSRRSGGKVANSLVALGSAVVITVYTAGYLRTRAAAEELEHADRRPHLPAPPEAGPPVVMPDPPGAPVVTAPKPVAVGVAATPRSKRPRTTAPITPVMAPALRLDAMPAEIKPAETTPVESKPVEVTPVETKPVEAPPPVGLYKDGTYYGWGTSRHGDIQASVVIHEGRITGAAITQCLTRYSCSWIAHLQGQVVTRQSAEVDYVSGATQSTNAFYYAILEALARAK